MFNLFVIVWTIAIANGFGLDIMQSKTQTLWIHLYLNYYLLGMVLYDVERKIKKIENSIIRIVSAMVFAGMSVLYILEYHIGGDIPYMYYNKWYYMMWLMSLFIFVSFIPISNYKAKEVIKRIAGNTFSVYMGHLPILLYFTNVHPLGNLFEAILCVLFLFIFLEFTTELFRKIPLLRRIV